MTLKPKSPVRFLAVMLSAVYFLTQVAFAHSAEVNFWTARKKAQLPRPSEFLRVEHGLPSALSQGLPESLSKTIPPSLSDFLSALPLNYGTIRSVDMPTGAPKAVVLYIQDVHQNAEAQANISQMVQGLLEKEAVDAIGLEGASGPIDLRPFHDFTDHETVRRTADFLLKENAISGAAHAAFYAQKTLPVIAGVDEPAHYAANVEAYRRAAPSQADLRLRGAVSQKDLALKKQALFNPELLAFDRSVQAYREGTISFGEYAKSLADETGLRENADLRDFLQALRLEETIDFAVVEKERADLIRQLMARLTTTDSDQLLRTGLAYKLGQVRYAEFYGTLTALCHRAGLELSRFPAMERYVRYVLLTDRVDPARLQRRLRELERRRYDSLARTPMEKNLLGEDRRLYLAGKLIDFALTPEEWKEYEKTPRGDELSSFESFYREAEARNPAMADNLLKTLPSSGKRTPVAVLVTGGFHTEGLSAALKKAGAVVVGMTPKITKVDVAGGSAYLSVFTREKSPLEKLFEGQKLFLAQDPIPPATRFRAQLMIIARQIWLAGPNRRKVLSEAEIRTFQRYWGDNVSNVRLTVQSGQVLAEGIPIIGADGSFTAEDTSQQSPDAPKGTSRFALPKGFTFILYSILTAGVILSVLFLSFNLSNMSLLIFVQWVFILEVIIELGALDIFVRFKPTLQSKANDVFKIYRAKLAGHPFLDKALDWQVDGVKVIRRTFRVSFGGKDSSDRTILSSPWTTNRVILPYLIARRGLGFYFDRLMNAFLPYERMTSLQKWTVYNLWVVWSDFEALRMNRRFHPVARAYILLHWMTIDVMMTIFLIVTLAISLPFSSTRREIIGLLKYFMTTFTGAAISRGPETKPHHILWTPLRELHRTLPAALLPAKVFMNKTKQFLKDHNPQTFEQFLTRVIGLRRIRQATWVGAVLGFAGALLMGMPAIWIVGLTIAALLVFHILAHALQIALFPEAPLTIPPDGYPGLLATPSLTATLFTGRGAGLKNLPARIFFGLAIPFQEGAGHLLAVAILNTVFRLMGKPARLTIEDFKWKNLWSEVTVNYSQAPPAAEILARMAGPIMNLIVGVVFLALAGIPAFNTALILSPHNILLFIAFTNFALFVADVAFSVIGFIIPTLRRGDFWETARRLSEVHRDSGPGKTATPSAFVAVKIIPWLELASTAGITFVIWGALSLIWFLYTGAMPPWVHGDMVLALGASLLQAATFFAVWLGMHRNGVYMPLEISYATDPNDAAEILEVHQRSWDPHDDAARGKPIVNLYDEAEVRAQIIRGNVFIARSNGKIAGVLFRAKLKTNGNPATLDNFTWDEIAHPSEGTSRAERLDTSVFFAVGRLPRDQLPDAWKVADVPGQLIRGAASLIAQANPNEFLITLSPSSFGKFHSPEYDAVLSQAPGREPEAHYAYAETHPKTDSTYDLHARKYGARLTILKKPIRPDSKLSVSYSYGVAADAAQLYQPTLLYFKFGLPGSMSKKEAFADLASNGFHFFWPLAAVWTVAPFLFTLGEPGRTIFLLLLIVSIRLAVTRHRDENQKILSLQRTHRPLAMARGSGKGKISQNYLLFYLGYQLHVHGAQETLDQIAIIKSTLDEYDIEEGVPELLDELSRFITDQNQQILQAYADRKDKTRRGLLRIFARMFHEWRGGNSFKTIIVFLLAAGFVFKTATPAHAAAIGTPAASQAPAGFLQGSLPGLSNPLYLFNLAAFGLVLLGSLAMRREGGIRYLGAGMIVLGLFSLVFTIATLTIGAGSWYLFLAAGIFFGGLVVVAMGWISQKRSEGAVATSWPYSGLRHPIYLGHIVWSFGLGMWQTSYLTGATGILPIAVGIIMAVFMWRATVARVQSEEAYLLRSHGRDYVAYSRDTPRGIEGRPPRLKFIVVVLLIIIGIVTLFWGLSAGWNLLQAIAVSSGTGGLLQMGMIAFVGGNTPRNSPLALSDGLDESALRALMRKAEELNEREHAVDRKAALMDELLRGSDLKLGLVDGSVDRTVEHMAAILGEGSVVVPVAAETPNLYGLVAAVARRYQAAQGASVVLAVQTFAMKERADDLILARGYANVKTILAPDAFRERAAIGGQKRYTFDVGLAKTNLLRLVSPFGLKVLRTANVDVVNEQAIRGAIVMAIDEWLKQVALSPEDWDALRAIAEAIQRSA